MLTGKFIPILSLTIERAEMRYFRNGQELGRVKGQFCPTCYRNFDKEGEGHSDTCPDRKRTKEVLPESIMPTEHATYKTGV